MDNQERMKQKEPKSISEMLDELDRLLPNYSVIIESKKGKKKVKELVI